MLIDGSLDGIVEGRPDRLGWNDGCALGEALGMELETVLIDGLLDGCEEGSVVTLGDSEGIVLGAALMDGLSDGWPLG